MGQYLKLFETHENYEDFVESGKILELNVSHCIQENEVHYNIQIDWSQRYFTIESIDNDNTIYFNGDGTNTISISTDYGNSWTEYTPSQQNTILATLNKGQSILIKGENAAYSTSIFGNSKINSTKRFKVKGNIMSLIYGDNYKDNNIFTSNNVFSSFFNECTGLISAENLVLPALTLTNNCYANMFGNCENLTTAPELPATTLANYCYGAMFQNTKITNAPKLPATTLAEECYSGMFSGCINITTAPELPALTLTEGCYNGMFNGCSSLTTAPELPATTLAIRCYTSMFDDCTSLTTPPELHVTILSNQECYKWMFKGCTSLTTAPELPATTLSEMCYEGMFDGCTSLIAAPQLSATTLAKNCYKEMFKGCTSLTTAPELPAVTLVNWCYQQMFNGCTNLNYIKAMFTTTPSSSYTSDWVTGVSATGTFVKNTAARWNVTSSNGVPTGWTVQTASQ